MVGLKDLNKPHFPFSPPSVCNVYYIDMYVRKWALANLEV